MASFADVPLEQTDVLDHDLLSNRGVLQIHRGGRRCNGRAACARAGRLCTAVEFCLVRAGVPGELRSVRSIARADPLGVAAGLFPVRHHELPMVWALVVPADIADRVKAL